MHINFLQRTRYLVIAALLLLVVSCNAIRPAADPRQTTTTSTFNEPFAYCATVGTIDNPDERYVGEKMPKSVVQSLIEKSIVTADAPAAIQQNATWRCMNHQVWVCHFGANIPCDTKADTSQTPSEAMNNFCKPNTSTDSIPAVTTGRATVYEWLCKDGKAVMGKQLFTADAQGYATEFWYELATP